MIERTWLVPADAAEKVRLDQYLARLNPASSRSQIQLWIRSGRVRINGEPTKTGRLLRPGDEIVLEAPAPPRTSPRRAAMPIRVLYHDDAMIVVDKPAGLVVHGGAGIASGTMVDALLERFGAIDAGDPTRPGIVHRLDKGTSGVVVVARTKAAHRELARQFKEREVTKEYLAGVYGVPAPPEGTIDLPIGRDPRNRKKISPRARSARRAITHYRIEAVLGRMSLLQVRIETGRTHQIRVHLAHRGHPVIGDRLYGGERFRSLPPGALRQAAERLDRPFLHAARLAFRHPSSHEPVEFRAPLPPELRDFLALAGAPRLDGASSGPL